MCSSPKPPAPPPPPPPPQEAKQADVVSAMRDKRKAGGIQGGTMLTGAGGLSGTGDIGRPSLLGQ